MFTSDFPPPAQPAHLQGVAYKDALCDEAEAAAFPAPRIKPYRLQPSYKINISDLERRGC